LLKWDVSSKVNGMLEKAKVNVQKMIDDNETCVYYAPFGSSKLKSCKILSI
jgi:hypothetical protein